MINSRVVFSPSFFFFFGFRHIKHKRCCHSQVSGDSMMKGDRLASRRADDFGNSGGVAIEMCHCLMLQPGSFGGSFKSHYTN